MKLGFLKWHDLLRSENALHLESEWTESNFKSQTYLTEPQGN